MRMRSLKPALLYFALVFTAGFALGPIRLVWAVPRFGTRTAELMEMPIMLAVTVLAARWVIRKFAVPPEPSVRLGVGGLRLALCLSRNLPSCSGFGDSPSANTSRHATSCREPFTM
jgi:hypothetical protein